MKSLSNNKKLFRVTFFAATFLLTALAAFSPLQTTAVGISFSTCSTPAGPQPYWCNINDVTAFLGRVLNYLFTIFLIVAVIMFIWAGFVYLTAGGEAEKLKEAKSRITWGVVAVVIALLSTSFRFVIESLLTRGTVIGF